MKGFNYLALYRPACVKENAKKCQNFPLKLELFPAVGQAGVGMGAQVGVGVGVEFGIETRVLTP